MMPENIDNASQEEMRSLIRSGTVSPKIVLEELLEHLDELIEIREQEDHETEHLRRTVLLVEIAVEQLNSHQKVVEYQNAWWAEQMAKRGEGND